MCRMYQYPNWSCGFHACASREANASQNACAIRSVAAAEAFGHHYSDFQPRQVRQKQSVVKHFNGRSLDGPIP